MAWMSGAQPQRGSGTDLTASLTVIAERLLALHFGNSITSRPTCMLIRLLEIITPRILDGGGGGGFVGW